MAELRKILSYTGEDIDKILQKSIYTVNTEADRINLSSSLKTTDRLVFVKESITFYNWNGTEWSKLEIGPGPALEALIRRVTNLETSVGENTNAIAENTSLISTNTAEISNLNINKAEVSAVEKNQQDILILSDVTSKIMEHKSEKVVIGRIVIQPTEWNSLTQKNPFKFQALTNIKELNSENIITIPTNAIVGLYNDDAVLFSNYGIMIGDITEQNVTIYCIKKPDSEITLKVGVQIL